jgi:hypothetical protein
MKTAYPDAKPALPSDRSFGWTFTGIFVIAGLFLQPWLLALAALTAAITLADPSRLAPLKRGWMKLGAAMHHVVSPVVMGLLYFGLFTPMGVAMRLFGWDAMKRTWDPAAKSYWSPRDPAGPAEDSFRNLF